MVINYVDFGLENCFKSNDDLSIMLKQLVEKCQVVLQFSSDLKQTFVSQCGAYGLQINKNKAKTMGFNSIKQDTSCSTS